MSRPSSTAATARPNPDQRLPRSSLSRRSNNNDHNSSPAQQQVGIPFAWEHLPGIPKTSTITKSSKARKLPLPPAGPPPRRNSRESGGRPDPFLVALLECSRDGGGRPWKSVWRSVSHVPTTRQPLQFSCKGSCTVSDSLVFLPASRTTSSYHVIRKTIR